jgi:hypothetical protein
MPVASRDSKNCSRGYREEQSPPPARDHAIGASYRGLAAFPRHRKRVDFKPCSAPIADKDRYRVIAGREYLVARAIDCGGKIGGERYRRPAADQLYLAGFLKPLFATGDAMQIAVHLSSVAARWRTSVSMRR